MDLPRITQLKELISGLNRTLQDLKERKKGLEEVFSNAKSAQGKLEDAVVSATKRVSSLEYFGLRSDFLEEIARPVRNIPDCSGLGNTVDNEILSINDQIDRTNNEICQADQEKRILESEEP